MQKLKNLGEFYNCGEFTAAQNQIIEVSDEKAAQLLTDFPKNWEKLSEHQAEAQAPEAAAPIISPDNKKAKIKNKK